MKISDQRMDSVSDVMIHGLFRRIYVAIKRLHLTLESGVVD